MEGASLGSGGVYVFTHYLSWLTLADVQVRAGMVGVGAAKMIRLQRSDCFGCMLYLIHVGMFCYWWIVDYWINV